MELWKNLRLAREKADMSQDAVAALFDISRAAVAQWESEDAAKRTKPDIDKLSVLAQAYGVSTDWLLTGREFAGTKQTSGAYQLPAVRRLPIVSWVQAGRGREAEDPHPPGDGDGFIDTTRRLGPNAYALKIRGDSMEPRFHEGDTIIVDPAIAPHHGSYVVVRFDQRQEATFKQLVLDGDRKYLKPLNERYPIEEIDESATLCGTWVEMVVD